MKDYKFSKCESIVNVAKSSELSKFIDIDKFFAGEMPDLNRVINVTSSTTLNDVAQCTMDSGYEVVMGDDSPGFCVAVKINGELYYVWVRGVYEFLDEEINMLSSIALAIVCHCGSISVSTAETEYQYMIDYLREEIG